MSILGEYLQRVKAERDEAVKLLRKCRNEFDRLPRSLGYDFTRTPELDAFLSRYDLPDDYDEA